jgi:hypothetical protein
VAPKDFGAGTKPELFDLVIFEGALPAQLPARPILAIAPTTSSVLGDVSGTLRDPGIGALDPDEPILRYVDLSTTHIGEAKKLALPAWARTIIPGPRGAPLLYAGERAGLRTAVLAFEPRRSDLPLQVAFPILVSNLVGELLGGSGGPLEAVAPGSPVTLPVPTGASGVRVDRPDGSTMDLAPGTLGGASVTFSETDLLGVYSVTPLGATASPAPSESGSAAPGGSPGTPPPVDPNAPLRFAVDLFDVGESTIAPGSAAAIEALGRAPGASPGAGGGGSATPLDRPAARDELWVPLLLIVLAALMVEWAVYERDALARFRRSLAARLAGLRARRS